MRIIVLLAAVLSLAASSALAQSASATATPNTEPRVELAAFPQPGKLTYAVIRDGDKIGSQ
ncbi:MAG TPA: hypothetical protein VFZ07_00500, partial [Dongiaceae bacterium]